MRGSVDDFFHKEERYGRSALAAWIGHPAIPAIIERRRVAAETTTMLFEKYLVDQLQIVRFCFRVFDVGVRYSDGQEEPNPFDPSDPEGWPLSSSERAAAPRNVADFMAVVLFTMNDLVSAHVPLDPEWAGDLVVVGQVLLLPRAGYTIPWDTPPAVLADKLQPVGISAIYRDGRSTVSRDGRPERAAINIDRIRRHVRAVEGGRDLRMPYAAVRPASHPAPSRPGAMPCARF
jgi:hypothetical protein